MSLTHEQAVELGRRGGTVAQERKRLVKELKACEGAKAINLGHDVMLSDSDAHLVLATDVNVLTCDLRTLNFLRALRCLVDAYESGKSPNYRGVYEDGGRITWKV